MIEVHTESRACAARATVTSENAASMRCPAHGAFDGIDGIDGKMTDVLWTLWLLRAELKGTEPKSLLCVLPF